MFKFTELSQIHLEITNNCQASCPMCSRNYHGGLDNPLIKLNTWSFEKFKTIINYEVLNQIKNIVFCGNFGDPILNSDLIKMCRYVKENAPSINVRIHTNGSARNESWWKELANSLPENHMVVFAIDGLENTHSLYRQGTDYFQILRNATAFIKAEGNADWTFIRFKHNEHEVEYAKTIAMDLGFKVFTLKDSSRFLIDLKFPVYDKKNNITHYLEPSDNSNIVFINQDMIENYKKIVEESDIICYAQKLREVYIDAFGRVFPCCWIASIPYNYSKSSDKIASIRQEMVLQYNNLIKDFGGIDFLDATKNTLQSIIDSDVYQTIWEKYWNDTKMITCARTCGVNKISKPMDQFIDKKTA
jgi:MoaA/NifB/PqqE/SkfB family radical SAM enzyme